MCVFVAGGVCNGRAVFVAGGGFVGCMQPMDSSLPTYVVHDTVLKTIVIGHLFFLFNDSM